MWAVEECRYNVSRCQHHLPASEFCQVINLSATVITLLKVSVEYAEDCSDVYKEWERYLRSLF